MSPETSNKSKPGQARFQDALVRFDQANADDPNRELVGDTLQPKELTYSRRMTEWLDRLEPEAAEPLRLAARCQHIRRWAIARTEFPPGRQGYRRWRTTLAAYHARTAAAILREVGYDDQTISRVDALLRKERLKADPDVQTLEDVACLVFVQHHLPSFATQHEEAKVVDILRKTWLKMSARGRSAALRLDLVPDIRALVEKALA